MLHSNSLVPSLRTLLGGVEEVVHKLADSPTREYERRALLLRARFGHESVIGFVPEIKGGGGLVQAKLLCQRKSSLSSILDGFLTNTTLGFHEFG